MMAINNLVLMIFRPVAAGNSTKKLLRDWSLLAFSATTSASLMSFEAALHFCHDIRDENAKSTLIQINGKTVQPEDVLGLFALDTKAAIQAQAEQPALEAMIWNKVAR
jgi:hypothetical protein